MMKEFKYVSLLLLSASLIGCGLAEPVEPTVETIDVDAPEVTQVNKPLNLGSDVLPQETDEIRLQLTEALDETTIKELDALEIKSRSGIELKGTWSYDSQSLELIYEIDRKNADGTPIPIPHSQRFRITMGFNEAPTVTDLAGNRLNFEISFSTISIYDIEIIASGLKAGEQIIVEQVFNDPKTTRPNITIESDSTKIRIDSNLANNVDFRLAVKQQPTDGSYCTFDNSQGRIISRNAEVHVTCTEVGPYKSNATSWNDYYASGVGFVHGGEQRALVTDKYISCADITASDDLDAFNWACEEVPVDTPTAIKVYSTSLKDGKGLTNLIGFSTKPSWQPNSVAVKYAGLEFLKTEPASWWNNPVFAAPANEALGVTGGVYVVSKDNGIESQNYMLQKSAIALVVSPSTTLLSASGTSAIQINGVFNSWLEGNINANGSTNGISVTRSENTNIRNVKISNALKDGIQISQESSATLNNVVSFSNGGNGISVDSNKGNLNSLKNIVTVNNLATGLYINSSNNKVSQLISINNKDAGLVVSKPQNTFYEIYSNNNIGDGVLIEGAQNNIFSSLTSASNDGNGILFTKTTSPYKNLIVNSTLANNKGSGIKFDPEVAQDTIDGVDGSVFDNVLDAFNAPTTCGTNACSGVITVATTDTELSTLFSHPTTDASYVNLTSNGVDYSLVKEIYNFNSEFRTWSSIAIPTAEAGSGSCNQDGVICQLLDLRLNKNDTFALNKLNGPTATSSYTYRGGTIPFLYLNNSSEILGDNIGNDNGLCEANESCVSATNIGSYFGHGSLTLNTSNTIASTNNITLYDFNENGIN